jgi:hypothetical protein
MDSYNECLNQYDEVGPDYCCAWWNGPGQIKIHFGDPELYRKFKKSKVNSQWAGENHTPEFVRMVTVDGKTLNWFRRWINRNDQPK